MKQKFTRLQLIQRFIDELNAERYLEIGVFKGDVFLNVNCKIKFGVDPKFRIGKGKRLTHNMLWKLSERGILFIETTSTDFFQNNKTHLREKPPKVVFIDGLHTFEQTLEDVYNTLNWLDKGGVIILHDCNPPHKACATPASSIPEAKQKYESENNDGGWTGDWCGDTWKVIPYLLKHNSQLNICVLDTDYGLGVISQKVPCDPYQYNSMHHNNHGLDEFESLSYGDLDANRKEMLNLKDLSDLEKVVRMHACQK